jgi:SAM-dependent methyltransferase
MDVPFTADAVQSHRYAEFYAHGRALRQRFRFDVRYRCRRTHEVLAAQDVAVACARVLDVGFGGGDLLASFPAGCAVTGAELSGSAVAAARADPRFADFAAATFVQVPEDEPEALPHGPYDVILSAHMLEHVPDDGATLAAIRRRLAPGGHLVLWVPIEEPDYIPFHVRAYSMQSIAERVRRAGLVPTWIEGSNHVNGHVWKLLTIPSRRAWPVVGPAVDAVRLLTLSMLGYGGQRRADGVLHYLGFGPRQALVVARAR